ncbi:MAG TPA: hypothetical protein VK610_00825 [Rhodothermales bacterium]|nr:hypothetical protein [Rhodothermales bacterium]
MRRAFALLAVLALPVLAACDSIEEPAPNEPIPSYTVTYTATLEGDEDAVEDAAVRYTAANGTTVTATTLPFSLTVTSTRAGQSSIALSGIFRNDGSSPSATLSVRARAARGATELQVSSQIREFNDLADGDQVRVAGSVSVFQ